MNQTLIVAAIAAAVSGVAGFGLAWQLQAGNISEIQLGYANERLAVSDSIVTALEANTRQVASAQAASTVRNVRVRVDADRAGNAGNGLRLASTAAVRTATDDPATCNSIIAAYGAVATASSDFIERVSRDADQCHSDLQMIQEAWPK